MKTWIHPSANHVLDVSYIVDVQHFIFIFRFTFVQINKNTKSAIHNIIDYSFHLGVSMCAFVLFFAKMDNSSRENRRPCDFSPSDSVHIYSWFPDVPRLHLLSSVVPVNCLQKRISHWHPGIRTDWTLWPWGHFTLQSADTSGSLILCCYIEYKFYFCIIWSLPSIYWGHYGSTYKKTKFLYWD